MDKQTINTYDSREIKAKKTRLSYCTDSKSVPLAISFKNRNWLPKNLNETWDIYWGSTSASFNKIFGTCSEISLQKYQIVNCFPNSYELSRKDLLYRNIGKYCKKLQLEDSKLESKTSSGQKLDNLMDFLPSTYILPIDYGIFLEEYRKRKKSVWIMKPCGRSLGTGISVLNSLMQIKEKMHAVRKKVFETYLISRYVENPLLIGGKKFDLRLYVLVTSFQPLNAFLYRFGFCRFATETYSKCGQRLQDKFIHLTNVNIQQKSLHYNRNHGGKWSLENLKLFLEGTQDPIKVGSLFNRIPFIVLHSLKAVSAPIVSNSHCFQLFGYDVIIDADLKPWLIEVNALPSLKSTTDADRKLKVNLIDDILNVVLVEKCQLTRCAVEGLKASSYNNFERLIEDKVYSEVSDKTAE